MKEIQPVLIGEHTYGNYYPASKIFVCSHGGWEAGMIFIDENTCKLKINGYHTVEYALLDGIPEEYKRIGE